MSSQAPSSGNAAARNLFDSTPSAYTPTLRTAASATREKEQTQLVLQEIGQIIKNLPADSFEEHVPLYLQEEWRDIEPLEVDDGGLVTSIQYLPHHKEAIAYFRSIMNKGEYSQRALDLTTELIACNKADYTAWEWRWRCLTALKTDLTTEYEFTDSIMNDNAKNYQLWNHRRKCAFALGRTAADRELEVAAEALEADDKNYHAWAHRQAVVLKYGGDLWQSEMEYTEQHLDKDLRNNSAWNQRAFIVYHELSRPQAVVITDPTDVFPPPPATGPRAALPHRVQHILSREISYLAVQVQRAPRNESVWNYLVGLFTMPGMPPHAMGMFQEVGVICREALHDAPSSPCALDTYAQFYYELACLHAAAYTQLSGGQHQDSVSDKDRLHVISTAVQSAHTAVAHCGRLIEALAVADPVRTMYWRQRLQELNALLPSAGLPALPPQAAAAAAQAQQQQQQQALDNMLQGELMQVQEDMIEQELIQVLEQQLQQQQQQLVQQQEVLQQLMQGQQEEQQEQP